LTRRREAAVVMVVIVGFVAGSFFFRHFCRAVF
jgi:hypothetical protein